MLLLDAVNLIMPKLGERPVTSLDVRHPTIAVLLPILDQKRRNTLMRGWWFNEYDYTAPIDVDGHINVGDDWLQFVPVTPDTAVVRGSRLFNLQTLTDVFTEAVKGRVTQDVEFESLPESAAQYVFYSALVDAYGTDIGVTQELSIWQAQAAEGWSALTGEHLRQKKYSTRSSRVWQRYRRSLQA